jgi:hypothetical protein
MTTLMQLQEAIERGMRRGESFSAVEDEIIEPSRLSDEAKSALWLYAWSLSTGALSDERPTPTSRSSPRAPRPRQQSRSQRRSRPPMVQPLAAPRPIAQRWHRLGPPPDAPDNLVGLCIAGASPAAASRLAVVMSGVGDVRRRGEGPDRRRADSL